MDLQTVSSLSALPLVSGSYNKLCTYYSDVKSTYPVANSLLTTVESNVSKAATVAVPYLEKYQPQIQKVDQMAHERVVKKLIDYCAPVVQKTPEELGVETKKRVNDVVETVRHRAVQTKDQIYAAPVESVKKGREIISTKYHSAVEVAGDKARKLRTEVPAMLPTSARQYLETMWTQYGLQQRYDQLWAIAALTLHRARKAYAESSANFPTARLPNLSTADLVNIRQRMEPYWQQTSKNFEATTELILESYNWLKASRLHAISTAREVIDSTVGAVWEYASDFSKELSESYSKGSSSEFLQIAGRRLKTGRDVATQLARWTYGELLALQDASTSVLDVILSSWLFHWLTFQPVMDRLPEMTGHEMEQPGPISSGSEQPRGAPFVPPTAGEPSTQSLSAEGVQKLHESFNDDDDEGSEADEEDEEDED